MHTEQFALCLCVEGRAAEKDSLRFLVVGRGLGIQISHPVCH